MNRLLTYVPLLIAGALWGFICYQFPFSVGYTTAGYLVLVSAHYYITA